MRIEHSYILHGLNCNNCAGKIERALSNSKGFYDVSLNFINKKLKFRSELEDTKLYEKVTNIVDSIETGITIHEAEGDRCNLASCEAPAHLCTDCTEHGAHQTLWGTILAYIQEFRDLIISLVLLLMAGFLPQYTPINQTGIILALYVVSYILVARDVLLIAFKSLRRGGFMDEHFLMAVATVGAMLLGEYREAVFVMMFYKVGEAFEEHAVEKSRTDIQDMLNIQAEYGNVIQGDTVKLVPAKQLKPGDKLLLRAGERVPVDCILLEGEAILDQSSLNGESRHRKFNIGDEILSSSINCGEVLHLEVRKPLSESVVTRIITLIEEAAVRKSKREKFMTKFARIYTPIVVALALVVAIMPPVLGLGTWQSWFFKALTFLVISCPCALVLSVPLAYFSGVGAMSRMGVLIKGGNVLDALSQTKAFAFDKTGTLTEANFSVRSVEGENSLELAALVEQYSTHPLAKAICEAANTGIVAGVKKIKEEDSLLKEAKSKDVDSLVSKELSQIEEIAGQGMKAQYKGESLLVGNERLLRSNFIDIPLLSKCDSYSSQVFIAYGDKYIGRIIIADAPKEGVKELISTLKNSLKARTIILTGDSKEVSENLAENLAVDELHAELLPDEKLEYVENYQKKQGNVLFMGDGINDAAVIMAANTGVAMGDLGSEASIEAADVVIMNDDPRKILPAIKLAKKTTGIVMQNIIFALFIKIAIMVLVTLGWGGMMLGVVADVGVTLICVLNSMRLLAYK